MTDPARNAAIWYASDAYDPASMGINGRRMAGQSFLRGFIEHADVDEFVSMTQSDKGAENFAEVLKKNGTSKPHRNVTFKKLRGLAPVGSVFYSAPNMGEEVWRRHSYGEARYSL